VSYVERHNEANGEGNRDGHPANFTSNWGVEGPTDDPAITEVRDRVKRAMLATVFFSAGTPMLLAGDEFGRSQNGNNNAYCQDNEISWLNWKMAASPPGLALAGYVARLAAIRREHPVLRYPRFMHGAEYPAPGIADIAWFDQEGATIPSEAWNEIEQRTLVLRRAMQVPEGRVTILTLLLNPTAEPCQFRLPPPRLACRVLLDSARPDAAAGEVVDQASVGPHSVVLLYSELAG
jgi:glycogen operon protein